MDSKVLSIILLLTISLVIKGNAPVTNALSEALIKVEPELVEYVVNATGQEFTVSVRIVDVVNLYGLDIQFRWDPTILEYVSHVVKIPVETYPDGVLYSPILPVKNAVNATAGTYWIAYASMYPAPAFSGTGTVFTMTFRVKYHPVQPDLDALVKLEFISTDLSDNVATPISHNVETGTVILRSLEVPIAKDAAITNVVPAKLVVFQNSSVVIDVTAENFGTDTVSFDVKAYYGDTEIGTIVVLDLSGGSSKVISFTWNTMGVPEGNYTISAEAFLVGDQNATNNRFVNGVVWVKMPTRIIPGDVTGDGVIDFNDIVAACVAYLSRPGDPHWNYLADLAPPEGYIDILDVVTVVWYWFLSLG